MEINPRIGVRAVQPDGRNSLYFEAFLALGPERIAGESAALPTFSWLAVVDAVSGELQLWQRRGEWQRVFAPGHPVIDSVLPEGARRISLCFDQSEHPVIGFELNETILVTRWDTNVNDYVQNVSFVGVDPVLWFDATAARPPDLPIPAVVEWAPSGQWFTPDGVIADSDVVVFYLNPERTQVFARVQRQSYLTPNAVGGAWSEPVVLDRVSVADFRFQLLASDASGAELGEFITSDPYVTGVMAWQGPRDGLAAGVALESIRVVSDTYLARLTEGIAAGVELEAIRVGQNIYLLAPEPEQLAAGVELEAIRVENVVYVHHPAPESLDAGVSLEDIEVRVSVILHAPEPEGINAGVSLEAIRVQKIA